MNRAYYAFYTLARPNDGLQYAAGDAVTRPGATSSVPIVFDFDATTTFPWNADTATFGASTTGYNRLLQNYPVIERPNNAIRIEQVTAVKNSAGTTNASFNLLFFDPLDRTVAYETNTLLTDLQSGNVDNTQATIDMLSTGYSSAVTIPLMTDSTQSTSMPFRRNFATRLRLLGVYSGTFAGPAFTDQSNIFQYTTATFVPPSGSPGIVINSPRVYALLVATGAYTPTTSEAFMFRAQATELL